MTQRSDTQRVWTLRRGPVVESDVMGRAAIAVCVAYWQLPALGYLSGVTGSAAISDVGNRLVPLLWSISFVVSGVGMIVVYAIRQETRQAQAEIVVLVVFTVAMTVYLVAILEQASNLDGRLAVIALLGSMITNATGRGVLLIRQILTINRLKRGGDR